MNLQKCALSQLVETGSKRTKALSEVLEDATFSKLRLDMRCDQLETMSSPPQQVLPFSKTRPSGHFSIEPGANTFETIVVDLTHRCNMECANCYIPNRTLPDLDIDRLFDTLKRLPKRTYIRLMGGEPTLREDLPQIITGVIKCGHRPGLLTNGLKLARRTYCEKLWAAGLRYVHISMNGADDDDVYRALDGGKYAKAKVRALKNSLSVGFRLNTSTIIASGINEHSIRRQIDLLSECAVSEGVNFDSHRPWSKVRPVLRIKSVGALGRYMKSRALSFEQLACLTARATGLTVEKVITAKVTSGLNFIRREDDILARSAAVSMSTPAGEIILRLVDWTVDIEGVPDPGNRHRGRLTRDFRIAPFFEDVKANEFGY